MKVITDKAAAGCLSNNKEYTVISKGDRDAVIMNDLNKQWIIRLEGQCPNLHPGATWTVIKDSIDDATPEEWAEVGKKIREKDEQDEALYKEVVPEIDKEVNSPDHYNTGTVECIEAIGSTLSGEEYQGYLRGNALKYLWRCMYKGKTKQDLEKCRWYLDKLIDSL